MQKLLSLELLTECDHGLEKTNRNDDLIRYVDSAVQNLFVVTG